MTSLQGAVLLVEDDLSIRRSLRAVLAELQFEVGEASTGEEALITLRQRSFDVVLMDLNMPGMGGMEACRRVRREFPTRSIIVITVRDDEDNKVQALEAGADDYVTKPFQVRELTARIRAAVRRSRNPVVEAERLIQNGPFELHIGRRSFKKHGEEIHLTPTEFDLLAYLMKHAGHPVLHSKLLSTVWGPEYGDEREYLRTYILQLRRKFEEDPSKPTYLKTVNYLGYVFLDSLQQGTPPHVAESNP
ncbi:MAG: response regulator transcription factor [Janthinobacterium lividum]